MKLLSVQAEIHWGYSIKVPSIGKSQPSLILPPPSTLIGAIVQPIAKHRKIGETITKDGKVFGTLNLYQALFRGASCRLVGKGTYWEDINRYIIALFQNKSRRFDPNYRFNAIPTGKVYLSGQKIKAIFVLDEKAAFDVLGETWHEEILTAGYEITRIGNKESIVSVEQVKLDNASEISGKVTTSLYFPIGSAHVIDGGEFFFADFWTSDYQLGEEPSIERYVVPASRAPIVESSTLKVDVKGAAYSNGEDTIIVAAR